jgi:WD40 repeat protein
LSIGQQRGPVTVWTEAGGVSVLTQTLQVHTAGVEDIVWSPIEVGVLSFCSCDGTIAIWDLRSSGPSLQFIANDTDINVIDWNRLQLNLICSGGDNGMIRVWDLRAVEPAAEIDHH